MARIDEGKVGGEERDEEEDRTSAVGKEAAEKVWGVVGIARVR